MTNPKVLNEAPLSMADIKKKLERIKNRDKELSFRAARTEEYLAQFVKLEGKEAQELSEKLQKLNIPRFREQHIIKIIDTMPKTTNDVKILLQDYTITISNENIKKIADLVSEYSAEK